MPRMVSLKEQLDKVCTLDEDDLNEWEMKFVSRMRWQAAEGKTLTEKQEAVVERIYAQHFT